MRKLYKEIHPFSKLGIVALVALLSLIASLVIAALIAIPVFGKESFLGLMSSSIEFTAENLNLLKYLQIAQSIGLFVLPSFLLAYLFGGRITKYLKLNRKPFATSIILATVVVLAASPLINLVGLWNMEMRLPHWMGGIEKWMKESEESAKYLTELFVNAENLYGLAFNILMIGLIPAIGEELLFRGVIQRVLSEWFKNKHLAIWLTAIFFSALHLQFYGFLPRMLLGAMFGYLLIWSNNLWLPIVAHFINNTVAVIAYYFYHNGIIDINPDAIGTNSEYGIAGMISLLVIVYLAWLFYSFEKKKRLEV
jgi:membrane protease YdiL (CAAX protease family)